MLPLWAPAFISSNHYWPFGEIGCRLALIPANVTIYASLYTLLAISVDRLLLVGCEYPRYMKLQSRYRVRATIVGCWVFATSLVLVETALWDYGKSLDGPAGQINFDRVCLSPSRDNIRAFSLTISFGLYFTPVVTVVGLSATFLYFLHRRLKKSNTTSGLSRQGVSSSQQEGASSLQSTHIKVSVESSLTITPRIMPGLTPITNNQHSSINDSSSTSSGQGSHQGSSRGQAINPSRSRYIKPTVSLLILVFAMAICMLPYCLYVFILEFVCKECQNITAVYALFLVQYCNACLDPFLYGLTQRKIRRFYCGCIVNNRVQPN